VHDGGRVKAATTDEDHRSTGRLGGAPAGQLVGGQLLFLLLLAIWVMLLFCILQQKQLHG
jgi:hypothetical protein